MPVLARFYGIVIRMYFLGSEHNPPHIHAIYGEDTAAFDIRSGENNRRSSSKASCFLGEGVDDVAQRRAY